MNFNKNNEHSSTPEINITSLVDIVFLLVLFFAVTTTFPQKPQGIKINLPKVNKQTRVTVKKTVRFYLDKEGKLYYNKALITGKELKEVLGKSKDMTVILDADKDTKHGDVVDTIESIKNEGVKKVLISVKYERK